MGVGGLLLLECHFTSSLLHCLEARTCICADRHLHANTHKVKQKNKKGVGGVVVGGLGSKGG